MNPIIKLLVLSAAISLIPLTSAQATYPGKWVAHWASSVSDESQDPDYEKVRNWVREEKYEKALDVLESKTQAQPQSGTPVILKGMVLIEQGNYKEALRALMEGQQRELRHPALHFGFCQVYRHLGQADPSERACHITVQQHPGAPETHYELAQTLAARGKMRQAAKALKKAIDLNPEDPQYPYELGMSQYYLGEFEAAKKAFEKALSLDETHLEAAYQLAYLHAAQKDPKKSKEYIYHILESRREHPKVQSAKVLLDYIGKGELDKLPLDIDPAEYHLSRSKALYQSGQYGLSFIEVQTAAGLDPKNLKTLEILVGMCSILLRLEEDEKAVQRFLALAEHDAIKAKGYQELGDIRVLQGRLDQAREFYEKARSLGDPGGLAQTTLAQFPQNPPTPNPSPFASNVIFINPAEALNRKGEVFAFYGMYDRAVAIYSMVVRMNPDHLPSMLNTAMAHYKNQDYNRAISILERLLVSHPNHEEIMAHRLLLAEAYVKNGDLSEGLKNINVLIRMNPKVKALVRDNPVFAPLSDKKVFQDLVR